MPQLAVAAGMAIISWAGTAIAAIGTGSALASAAVTVISVASNFAGALLGTAGLMAAVSAWGTVALFASTALSRGPPKVGQGAAGSQVNFQADPNAGIPLMLGRSGTGGKIIHANTVGQEHKNSHLYYLIALSGGVIDGLESLTCNDQLCTINEGTGEITGPSPYGGAMDIRWCPGRKPEPGVMPPPGFPAEWAPEWTPDHITSGVACVWWSLIYAASAFPTGVPKPIWVVRGPPVYDPRKDSTIGGGSGPQRADDESTWSNVGFDNPFLQALTWCIGRRDNGKLTFGIGAPLNALDLEAFAEGAGVCEANGWRCGGEVLSTDGKWEVLKTILQAGGGEPIRLGGRISCMVRTPRVAIANLTGRDVIGDASITGGKGRRDRFNQIVPSYRSETHGWEMVPAGPVTVPEYVTADGELRSKGGSYGLVQDAKQAAELACYDILDAREFEPVALPLGPKWGALQPGDVITVTEPEYGLDAQQLLVETRDLDPVSGQVTVTCRSETPGKHAYALGRTPHPPPIPGLKPLDPTHVSNPETGSWTAWGGVIRGADGQQVPAIVITGHVDDPNVSNILADIRLELDAGTATFGDWMTTTHPSGVTRIEIRAVVPGGTYNVRVRYKTVRLVEGVTGLDLGLVTVGTMVSGGVTTIGGQTPEELIDQLNQTTELGIQTSQQAAQTANDLIFTNQNLYDSTHLPDGTDLETYAVNGITTAQGAANYSVTRVDAIGILRGDGRTFQLSDATLYADGSQTWGQYKNSLQTSIGNNTSAITTEQTTRANADSALATRIDNLTTTVNGNTASITTLQSSVNGLNAQWVLSVSSTGPGYARVAGIKVASSPTVSSIAFAADQIGFTNGTDNVFPLAVVGGKVIATNFQADDIKANTITANMIIGGAITSTVVNQGGQQVNSVGAAVEDLRFNYTSIAGGTISLQVYGELGTTTSAAAGTVFTLYCDGTDSAHIVGQGSLYCPGSWGGTGLSFPVAHQPAPGPHTYVLWHVGTSGSGASRVNRTEVILTELKR